MKLTDMFIAQWNALVPSSWLYRSESETHFHFVHPTKGKRKVSKRRLGITR